MEQSCDIAQLKRAWLAHDVTERVKTSVLKEGPESFWAMEKVFRNHRGFE